MDVNQGKKAGLVDLTLHLYSKQWPGPAAGSQLSVVSSAQVGAVQCVVTRLVRGSVLRSQGSQSGASSTSTSHHWDTVTPITRDKNTQQCDS